MKKCFFVFAFFFALIAPNLHATVYKGQKIFVKECLKCHKGGQTFVASKTIRDWKKLMSKKGEPLAKIHLESEEVKNHKRGKKAIKYFKHKKFKKKSKHLRHFLIEYAKDSGNAPACD